MRRCENTLRHPGALKDAPPATHVMRVWIGPDAEWMIDRDYCAECTAKLVSLNIIAHIPYASAELPTKPVEA